MLKPIESTKAFAETVFPAMPVVAVRCDVGSCATFGVRAADASSRADEAAPRSPAHPTATAIEKRPIARVTRETLPSHATDALYGRMVTIVIAGVIESGMGLLASTVVAVAAPVVRSKVVTWVEPKGCPIDKLPVSAATVSGCDE